MSKYYDTISRAYFVHGMIFKMEDEGKTKQFLGINISQRPDGIYSTQTAYIDNILQRFHKFEFKLNSLTFSAENYIRLLE